MVLPFRGCVKHSVHLAVQSAVSPCACSERTDESTSAAIECDQRGLLKNQGYHCTRLRKLYTTGTSGSDETDECGREVVPGRANPVRGRPVEVTGRMLWSGPEPFFDEPGRLMEVPGRGMAAVALSSRSNSATPSSSISVSSM